MNEPGQSQTLALSVKDVAREMQLGRNTVLELIHSGRLPHVRIGRRILVPRRKLEEFLERKDIEEVQ